MRCTCAVDKYRNLPGGKQERKLVGSLTCTKCRGAGRITPCEACSGCGLLLGQVCKVCFGSGVIPLKKQQEAAHGA